jgi:thiosulfate/3-mercaptopyruvate sulfurtransferase
MMASDTQAVEGEPAVSNDQLVDADWLEANLGKPNLRIVEVDVASTAYDDWHIDGAVLWNVYQDLKSPDYRPVGTAGLQQLVVRSGIGSDSTVVFYGYAPALGLWLMDLYGHRDVRILDCSREAWRTDGRPWTTSVPGAVAGDGLPGDGHGPSRADRDDVLRSMGTPGETLVDVRSEAEFVGERFWPSGGQDPQGRAGHIPSAVHQPIDGLYDERGSFRSIGALRRVFSSVDLEGDDELIVYCTIGGRAATAWFVLTHLLGRRHVCVYDGSWAEWGRMAQSPVEPE